jgi:hypothetical protein
MLFFSDDACFQSLIDANILIYKNMSGTLKFTAGEIKYPAPHPG